jgi:hypothetical protein
MNKRSIIILTAVICVLAIIGIGWLLNRGSGVQQPTPATILSTIKQEADLVVTEVTIRKIAYYDSSLHEHVSITDPSTWKYGDRKCIVPVEIKIKYGYDLREMTLENVKVNDSLRIIEVTLPEAKIIDSGYDSNVDYDQVVCISTGLRDEVGHETIEKIRTQAYEAVMKEDFQELVGHEIRNNAQTLLNSLALSLGFEGCTIIN